VTQQVTRSRLVNWFAPRRGIRLRLTLIYWSLSLVSAAGLLALTDWLTALRLSPAGSARRLAEARTQYAAAKISRVLGMSQSAARHLVAQAAADRASALHTVLVVSAIALAVMLVASAGVGWLFASRALRPLRVITWQARRISAENLNDRLAMDGPRDELRDLADTFDGLLARLEAAFAAQRQFAANVSHELRTPLTLQRSIVEVALSDRDATAESLATACRRVLAAGEHQERLIEALFTLAKGQHGLEHHEPLDLAAVASEILLSRQAEAERADLTVATALCHAPASGDLPLVERLMDNLMNNAIRYNKPGGRIEISTGTDGLEALFVVINTGPVIGQQDIDRLFEPFQRLGPPRTGDHDGLGLGLPIVSAIATAHYATVAARTQPGGGLRVETRFPLAAAPAEYGAATATPGRGD
jgi:signal transduction histidine kinase